MKPYGRRARFEVCAIRRVCVAEFHELRDPGFRSTQIARDHFRHAIPREVGCSNQLIRRGKLAFGTRRSPSRRPGRGVLAGLAPNQLGASREARLTARAEAALCCLQARAKVLDVVLRSARVGLHAPTRHITSLASLVVVARVEPRGGSPPA